MRLLGSVAARLPPDHGTRGSAREHSSAKPVSACTHLPPAQPLCRAMAARACIDSGVGQLSSAPGRGRPARKRPAAASARDAGEYSSAIDHFAAAVAHEGNVWEYSSAEERSAAAVAHEGDVGEYSPAAPPVTRRARRRPAAAVPVRYEADDFQGLPPATAMADEPEWARKTFDAGAPVGLPWADDIVHKLVHNGHLPSSSQKKVNLKLWSDCSGINSEKFSWSELQDAMKRIIGADVSLGLYYTCDSDPKSIAFAKANHQPEHLGTDMSQRNFTSGEFWCALVGDNISIPKAGVDVYVGTYPCSPWSRRGSRTGWDHPSVQPMRIGLQTISYTQPAVWIVELGELPETASLDEILSGIRMVLEADGRQYIVQVVRSLGPQAQGYPINRSRTFFVGWRGDVCPDPAVATQPLLTLTQNPVDVTSTYRGFLKISSSYDWSEVGNFYVGASLAYMSGTACRCACDPYVLCPVHLCKCDKCGDDGLGCTWRKQSLRLLEKENALAQARSMHGKVTYVHALEMQGGVAPTQPRARIILNIAAMLPQSNPLHDTLMLVDKSQNPGFGTWISDGMAQTLTTNSQLWCMSAGRELEARELAALMGLDTSKMALKGQTEAWFRKRLGLTVHVANFGLVLAAVMAGPLQSCLA